MSLVVEHIQKSYAGRRVVDGVSFNVEKAEIVGLLGRNGAGKTTSFDMCLGLVTPEKGKITLNGTDISKMAIHLRCRLGIGYLPQEASIFRKLSCYDNLRLILELKGKSKREQKDRIEQLLTEF